MLPLLSTPCTPPRFLGRCLPADYLTACLVWLEKQGKGNLPSLLRRFTVPDGNLTALTIRGWRLVGDNDDEEGVDGSTDPVEDTQDPEEETTQDPPEEATSDPLDGPSEDTGALLRAARKVLAAGQGAAEAGASLAGAAATATGAAAAAGPVTLRALAKQVEEAQRVLLRLKRAHVPLRATPQQVGPVAAMQVAIAKVQKQHKLPGSGAASAKATGTQPLEVVVRQVLVQLQQLVVQLQRISEGGGVPASEA